MHFPESSRIESHKIGGDGIRIGEGLNVAVLVSASREVLRFHFRPLLVVLRRVLQQKLVAES